MVVLKGMPKVAARLRCATGLQGQPGCTRARHTSNLPNLNLPTLNLSPFYLRPHGMRQLRIGG